MSRIVDKSMRVPDGKPVRWLEKNYKHYLNRTTILYGRTNTGKTTIIDEIMFLCKPYISFVFVICQSSETNDAFRGKVPDSCIKTGITKTWVERFLVEQKNRAALYKMVNNIETLQKLFAKIKNSQQAQIERLIIDKTRNAMYEIERDVRLDHAHKKFKENEIKHIQNEHLRDLYKKAIRSAKPYLLNQINQQDSKSAYGHAFSPEETCCVKFLDFQPHAMLIFDDCAAIFKKWVKESPAIKEMIYTNRHIFLTIVATAQSDKEVDSELRDNALVSIFTTRESATLNFTRASNGYSKEQKTRSGLCIHEVFKLDYEGHKHHKKLVYMMNDPLDPYYYTIADIYPPFKVGCPAIWEIDKKINAGDKHSERINNWASKYS